ncbi:hypothetical protein [Nostoc sp. UHCC 0251]|uniref:hypothetical protein n=1 Tax=Nostoc sp. UHCC 0251 TaxID=3110240 RepID=UPI002B1FA0D9|nr:hypothetical protein [Nostoc sp. UHCC 0251]MEA5625293.1 hypothetical protein [Nostoc sp. UHCC 0251]
MEVNLHALIKYLTLLCELKDGDEIFIDGYVIKREGNKIWQHIFDYYPEGYEEEDVEGKEET